MAELTYKEMGLNDEEYAKILELLGREPNYLELGMFSVMWSEHCGYKNSRPLLKTLPTEGPVVIHGPGENAGVIDIGDGQALAFKIESHNHPSAVEPYEGAATGVGGVVRDIFTMGARPIALLDSLRFGSIEDERVQELFWGATAGIAGYGNRLGVPTVGGEVCFNPCYQGNPLVNAMAVGLVNIDEITLAVAGEVGSPLIIVGAKTGRDGIHGATFASEEISDSNVDKRPTVQAGDAFLEKLLMEACLEMMKEKIVAGMQDLGAAGYTCSIAETASKKGRGAKVDVLKMPRREEGMTAYELMLAESQERMLIVPKPGCEDLVFEICAKWNVEAATIGHVTDDGLFKIYEGETLVGEIPVNALTEECPVYVREGIEPAYYSEHKAFDEAAVPEKNLQEALIQLLASPNIASKKWAFSQFDYQAMTNTVVIPGAAGAAVIRIKDTPKGIAMTTDCNGRMVYLDPYQGTMMAVCEAARNLACVGARPLALTNCLNFGSPEKLDVYWQLQKAIQGITDASQALNTPVVSGNVSLYNETESAPIHPTPIIGMIGILPDVNKRQDMAFKAENDVIVLLGDVCAGLGGSEYLYVCQNLETGKVPEINLSQEKALLELLLKGHELGIFNSCHDIAEGGLAVTIAESAIAGSLGADVNIPADGQRKDGVLFSEAPARVVASLNPRELKTLEDLGNSMGIAVRVIGKVAGNSVVINIDGEPAIDITLEHARKTWGEAIQCIME